MGKNRPVRYVYVNLPAYKLRVFNKHMVKKVYDVVVGTPWTKTPLLNSEIEYFTTNPKWYVPLSISKNEILPRIKKDPNYLARHGYKVYDTESNPVSNVDWSKVTVNNFNLRFQQKPGNGNAMGRIKFYFDSGENNILIHDTNDKSKFSKDIRAYSHGCIRISNPVNFGASLVSLENLIQLIL
ncbi:MAG: L,D-transpeptidase family protein [Chloroflexia bacterium]|nr:L,D-transpeptidase family protein [Chloroflexia bacterium]